MKTENLFFITTATAGFLLMVMGVYAFFSYLHVAMAIILLWLILLGYFFFYLPFLNETRLKIRSLRQPLSLSKKDEGKMYKVTEVLGDNVALVPWGRRDKDQDLIGLGHFGPLENYSLFYKAEQFPQCIRNEGMIFKIISFNPEKGTVCKIVENYDMNTFTLSKGAYMSVAMGSA